MLASVWAACTVRYVLLVLHAFKTSSVSDQNESFKAFLTLIEIIGVKVIFMHGT